MANLKLALCALLMMCSVALADPLTPEQLNNLNTQNDINVNIWVIKGSARDIQALQAIVNQEITTLRLKGIAVPHMNWSDLNNIGSINWAQYGYGTQ